MAGRSPLNRTPWTPRTAVRAWSAFRDSLDALGGDAEPQFDLLAEAFK
jgi:hypothetical protein